MTRTPLLIAISLFLLACQGTGIARATEARAAARAAMVTVDLKDQVFGTRLDGLFMKPTKTYATGWNSNGVAINQIKRQLAASGIAVKSIKYSRLRLPGGKRSRSMNAALGDISKAMSAAHPGNPADVHIIISHVPVDPVPRPARNPALGLLSGGAIDLLWSSSQTYKQSYVVRSNVGMNASMWGKVQCIVVYSIAIVDAKTHKVRTKKHPRWTEAALPDDFWIQNYRSLAASKRSVLKKSCLSALLSGISQDLRAFGYR